MASRRSRRRFDDDLDPAIHHLDEPSHQPDGSPSTYPHAIHGPEPVPGWVVTHHDARDDERGVLKSGKEADVHLVERGLPGGPSCLLAVKRYRSAHHRQFHRDAAYLEGRRVRESREMRAIERRTAYGRTLIAEQWAIAEFRALGMLWNEGIPVPYPVQLLGNEVSMAFIGSDNGVAAPRLAEVSTNRAATADVVRQVDAMLAAMVSLGVTHGDLSPYNLLVHEGRVTMIDLPQVVDLAANPQGLDYLRRDCTIIATWATAHGVAIDGDEWSERLLASAGRFS